MAEAADIAQAGHDTFMNLFNQYNSKKMEEAAQTCIDVKKNIVDTMNNKITV